MQIVLGIIVNFILYYSAGSIVLCRRRREEGENEITAIFKRIVVGFFTYYALFFVFCVPVMKFYRPLSMLTGIWTAVVLAMVLSAAFLHRRARKRDQREVNGREKAAGVMKRLKESLVREPVSVIGLLLLVLLQIVLVSCTYNFTLDAAYYVAGVATNVDTNMINVYDPFTGAWQDHFEMRYFFATYSVQDAVVCQLTGIAPLVWTKSVMATVIILLTNMVYALIAGELFCGEPLSPEKKAVFREKSLKPVLGMLFGMFLINVTYNTIYTSSLFLMTRTYEGKAIVGNLAVATIFYLFLRMYKTGTGWLLVFLVCFGASTISSTANMLMPVEVTVLFLPYIIRTKSFRMLPRYVLCVAPGVIFSLLFVLYVKGYFVFYTYPR